MLPASMSTPAPAMNPTVTSTLIPTGATFDNSSVTPVGDNVKAVPVRAAGAAEGSKRSRTRTTKADWLPSQPLSCT